MPMWFTSLLGVITLLFITQGVPQATNILVLVLSALGKKLLVLGLVCMAGLIWPPIGTALLYVTPGLLGFMGVLGGLDFLDLTPFRAGFPDPPYAPVAEDWGVEPTEETENSPLWRMLTPAFSAGVRCLVVGTVLCGLAWWFSG